MKNPTMDEIASIIRETLNITDTEYPIFRIQHNYLELEFKNETNAYIMAITAEPKKARWRWHAAVHLRYKEINVTVLARQFADPRADISPFTWKYVALMDENPVHEAVRHADQKVVNCVLKELENSATKEQFLQIIGTIRAAEIAVTRNFKNSTPHPLDHHMRPILRIGSRFGVTVHDIDQLFDTLAENYRIATEISK
jgi:hypothetical protein